ncbi:MAG: nuclear transport factor 2 family protein [Methylocystis sp.]
MSHAARNTEILKEAYRRWNDTKGGSVDHWLSLLAPKINFGSLAQGRPDALSFTQTRESREGVADYLRELTRDWAMDDYRMDVFVAELDRVVAIGRCAWRHKTTGKRVDTPKADVWRFDADGRVVEFFEYYDTAAVIEGARP